MKNFIKKLFASLTNFLLGQRVGNTRVVPVMSKILVVFASIILISNLSSNYINLILNRSELIKQMRELLAKDLDDIFQFCDNEYNIYQLTKQRAASLRNIKRKGDYELESPKSLVLGVHKDGSFFFQSSHIKKVKSFPDRKALDLMKKNLKRKLKQEFIKFRFQEEHYFAVYRYNPRWGVFIIRAEEEKNFYSRQKAIFWGLSGIIFLITLASALIGIYLLRHILRYVNMISSGIIKMLESQKLEPINLQKAANDDISFLGIAFNSLLYSLKSLLFIFQKFANQDVVAKAYREREVRLEGSQRELTILFSDIKSFTFITEILGSDIINLLNLHYDRAIRRVIQYNGLVGSIIGDALLAVFGIAEAAEQAGEQENKYLNKSEQAIRAAYDLHEVKKILHEEMKEKRSELLLQKGRLSPDEERIYQATLLEIGVGIDGGQVFYGTLGSYVRMTNTVIGDNVNAASRLEGLTRIYKVPVICSEYVKQDISNNVMGHGIRFVELDRVQVKGKTQWQRIYWPMLTESVEPDTIKGIRLFEEALAFYYKGQWPEALARFKHSSLPPAEEFRQRISSSELPQNWSGVWEMKTK